MPSALIKNIRSAISPALTYLFNSSLSNGVFPSIWKSSYIIPLHKSGPKNDEKNYRGICKLSCIPKLFESIVTDFMYNQCKTVISPIQHGFVRSTATNLIEISSTIVRNFGEGLQTDVIYTDFSKAFDRVHHDILLTKLEWLGFPKWLLKWIKSYLCGRTQRVIFKNSISVVINVFSGVPQGSHIGPILFILFINGVCVHIKHSSILMYADDCKLFKSCKTEEEFALLQQDLDSFISWCNANGMSLNVSKCFIMSYSRSLNVLTRDYMINGEPLKRTEFFRDLGVLFDVNCTFVKHVDCIINKAMSKLGCIMRWSKELNDNEITMLLYSTHVRSQLENCSAVWCPRYGVHIDRLESVQKQFMIRLYRRRPENFVLPSYKTRLKEVKLHTVQDR